ncbi:hypothetical protein B9Z19DRAFT_1005599 [Tuber borchii]|uniref:Uncharacterized protein n=1 Tax=Tuber borchii TaxID=42251 RepID=A0A2T6ZCJ8_TUBBO|nr:hypothetical protein B9Z19DRAFT_1005599 [Tuber borchii]
MYPDQPPLKPEERGIVADVQSNPDSGFSAGEDRRDSRMVILSPVGGTGAEQAMGVNGGGPDNLDDGSGAAKEWKEKRWLGVKARIILLGLGMGLMLLLAVGLGVGLGMGLKKSSDSGPVRSISSYTTTVAEVPPSSEETGPPISEPNNTFPNIATGMAVLTPLILEDISSDCLIKPQDPFSPGFFNIGSDLLWSCQNSPDKPLVWKFDPFPQPPGANMDNFPSHPDFLKGAEYGDGDWGGYMLSSLEGIIKFDGDWDMVVKDGFGQEEYSNEPGWRDGTQNPLFWHIPLEYYNYTTTPASNKLLKLRSNNNSTSVGKLANYKFGILYNKTVVLKQSAIDQTLAVLKNTGGLPKFANGTALGEGEIVWKCVWEKTLLDVEISINQPSLAQSPTVFAGGRGPPGHGDGDDGLGDGPGGGQGSGGFSQGQSGTSSGSSPGDPQGPPGGPPPQNSFNTGDGGQFKPPATTLAIPTPTGLNTSIDGTDGADEPSDIPIAGVIKRGETLPYPLKITIQETRPTASRLRYILGMDLTDADPSGRSRFGDIKCTRMVVTPRGGLRELIDGNGGGFVVLREPMSSPRKRDSTSGGCSCRWVS